MLSSSTPSCRRGSRGTLAQLGALRTDSRGAVYLEFLIAFLPLFVFFSGLLQLGLLELADLVTRHSAVMAARAAVVVLPDNPLFYGGQAVNQASGQRLDDIETAAKMTLNSVDVNPQLTVTFPSSPGGSDNRSDFGIEDTVRVQVHYTYPCKIPIGNVVACGGGSKTLIGEAAMPLQGANYKYPGS